MHTLGYKSCFMEIATTVAKLDILPEIVMTQVKLKTCTWDQGQSGMRLEDKDTT